MPRRLCLGAPVVATEPATVGAPATLPAAAPKRNLTKRYSRRAARWASEWRSHGAAGQQSGHQARPRANWPRSSALERRSKVGHPFAASVAARRSTGCEQAGLANRLIELRLLSPLDTRRAGRASGGRARANPSDPAQGLAQSPIQAVAAAAGASLAFNPHWRSLAGRHFAR